MLYSQDPIHEQIKTDIWNLRSEGNIDEAILKCEKATQEFINTYFYPKILGDLYLVKKDYIKAAESYTLFLKRIRPNKKLFIDFTKRYYRNLSEK